MLPNFLAGDCREMGGDVDASTPRDLVRALVEGRPVPREALDVLAARYLIAVVSPADAGRDWSAMAKAAGPGLLTARLDREVVLLVPDVDADRTRQVIRRLTCCLNGQGWLATARRPTADLVQGVTEAADVLRLVLAGRRPSGAYTISDVLVEYAATRQTPVIDKLISVVEPLSGHAVLWETLTALIDADYNRNEAARRLFVHRSTLDYRLRRIAALTGWDPASGRGAQLLTTALIAHALSG